MPLTEDIRQILAEAQQLEKDGLFDKAEACYFDAIKRIDQNDKELRGIVYIELGKNAEKARRQDDAIKYYSKAINHLEGLKGEAILQSAHAHWNIAKIYLLQKNDPRAVSYSEQAVQRYIRYPLTPPADLAEAKVLHVFALMRGKRSVTQKLLVDAWASVKEVPFKSFGSWSVTELVIPFLINFLCICAKDPSAYQDTRREVEEWAGLDVAKKVFGIVERVKNPSAPQDCGDG